MGGVNPSLRAVSVSGPVHVLLVVVHGNSWVVARWEVNVSAKWRSFGVTVYVWESNTCTLVLRILNAHSVQAIRISWIGWTAVAVSWTCPLNGLGCTNFVIEN